MCFYFLEYAVTQHPHITEHGDKLPVTGDKCGETFQSKTKLEQQAYSTVSSVFSVPNQQVTFEDNQEDVDMAIPQFDGNVTLGDSGLGMIMLRQDVHS